MVSAEPPARAESLTLVGGDLALDFANTCSGRGFDAERDYLRSPEQVAAWAALAKILSVADAERLAQAATGKLGPQLLAAALKLREDIYLLGAALAAGAPAPPLRVKSLTAAHARALARGRLAPIEMHFGWTWDPREAPIEAILGPISLSALTLLQQADLTRVKQCPGERCGWLFFDATKNRSRRWCEMEVCGNRAKQKRFARSHPR